MLWFASVPLSRQLEFTLTDFRDQMRRVKKLGSMGEIMQLIPGMGQLVDQNPEMGGADEELRRIEGIINAMTPRERENPDIIDNSRRRRIAQGSGFEPSNVNDLLKQFRQMAGMMQKVAGLSKFQQMKALSQMANTAMQNPEAQVQAAKQRSKRGPLDTRAEEDKKKRMKKEAKKQRKKNKR